VRLSLAIHPFLQLAKQRYYWSLPRLARITWALVTHSRQQREVFQVLALPALHRLAFRHPELPFKYLSRDYLARGLSTVDRASCFRHHYSRIASGLPAELLREVLCKGATLLEKTDGEDHYAIVLGHAHTEVREGELYLELRMNGEKVYVLQFTVVPGEVVSSAAEDVILVSRLQGMKGCYAQVHSATRAFRDVAPPVLLMAVLQGVAQALDIHELAAVSATSQFSYLPEYAERFVEAYDQFFLEAGAIRSSRIFLTCALPLEEKPVEGTHKTRTKKKRVYRRELAEAICRTIREGTQGLESTPGLESAHGPESA
jgi:uncharacterized protein VirK/YbjX